MNDDGVRSEDASANGAQKTRLVSNSSLSRIPRANHLRQGRAPPGAHFGLQSDAKVESQGDGLKKLEVTFGNEARLKLQKRLWTLSDQAFPVVWPRRQSLQSLFQLGDIAVAKRNSARADGLRQTAPAGSNHRATASDAFESDDAERLIIFRRDNERLMLMQSRGEFRTGLRSSKFDLGVEAKLSCEILPSAQLRPGTHDSELQAKVPLAQATQSLKKN